MKLKILTVKKIMLLCFAVALLLIFSACGAASASAPDSPSVDPLPVEQEVPISVVYPDTEAVMLVHSAEELAELDTLYPNLRTLDVSGSKCLDAILSYAESHPDVEVIYTVSIGGRDIAFTDEVISCRSAEELNDLAACIHALPALTRIDLSAMPLLPSQINELQAVFPGLALQYNLDILGVSYPRESDTISLVGITAEDLKPVLAALPWFPNLQVILLTDGENNCSLSCEELAAIAAAAPQAALRYDFELFGTTVAADAERLEYVKVNIGEEGVETLRQVLPFMTKLNYVLLDSCDISNDTCAALRDEFPEKHIVWRIMLRNDGKYFLSDTEMIVCNQLTDKEAKRLVYFTNLKYLDVGHGYFSSMDFLASLPKLEVLIIALNLAEDLSPITCCTELEYLEVFSTRVSDISALAGLTKLEHLNISNLNGLTDLSPLYGLENLKRLRGTMNGRLPDEQKDQIRQMLPNCIIEFGEDGDRDPTGGCWRYDAEGNYVERYALLREQFQYGK